MSESNNTGDKTEGRQPIKLKTGGGSGTVRQSFSHGRTKAVIVEKKRKRIVAPKTAAQKAKEAKEKAQAEIEQKAAAEAAAKAPTPTPVAEPTASGAVLQTLTKEEQEKRLLAIEESKVREIEESANAKVMAKRQAEEDAKRAKERESAAEADAEKEAAKAKEAEATKAAELEAARKLEDEEARRAKAEGTDAGAKAARAKAEEEEKEKEKARNRRGKPEADKASRKGGDARRRSGKLTINRALIGDDGERGPSIAARRRRLQKQKMQAKGGGAQAPKHITREVVIPEAITVQELANRMAVRVVDVIKFLMLEGSMLKHQDLMDADMAELIVAEFGHTVKRVSEADVEEGLVSTPDDEGALVPRSPVVTIMGHVDHGKTSLLDAMRNTDVVAGEAGGITQHIGAYQVELAEGQKVTFLDTPGHAAFTQMRARGANVTDIVILVVAADDGVMPQTIEAINHAKAAEVPIIVAINKCDKPDASPDRVRQELLQHEIVVESLGGDIQDVEVSALKKQNLEGIREAIALQAEILELKANPDRAAQGIVVEARLDKGRGAVATVLIQQGTLKIGDILVAGAEWGKVRALIDDRGQQIESAGPSVPVEVLGLNGTPDAGDPVAVVETEGRAREVTEYRQRKRKDASVTSGRGSLEQMLAQLKEGEAKEFPILVKGDVQGSVEAIVGALDQLSTDEVAARAIHTAVGGISESDVILAHASGAPILAFNVRANKQAQALATRDGVEIRYYSVIYNLIDDVKAAMSGMLDPTIKENFVGYAEILEVFNISKVGKIGGCRVTEGIVKRGNKVRLLRDDVVIHEGTLSTLKRFKDEVKEVVSGQECGMAFENYHDLQVGDRIECFEIEIIERSL